MFIMLVRAGSMGGCGGGVTPPQELSLAIYSVKFDFWSVKLCYEVLY